MLERHNRTASPPTPRVPRVRHWIPGLLVAAGFGSVLAFWTATGVPLSQSVLFLIAWTWVVVLPGWVLSRSVWGKPRQLVSEVAMAAGIGIVVSTIVWLVLVAASLQGLFLLWPLLTAPCLLFAKKRLLDFGPFDRRMSPSTAAGLALTAVGVTGSLGRGFFATSALPPGALNWYVDTSWHLGLVHELGRSMPAYDPQVFGEPFWYHWFANAHVASLVGATGLDAILVFVRLWQPMVLFTVLLLFIAASEILTGRLWPGVVAGVTGFSATLGFTWFDLPGLNSMNIVHSPSHQWALVPMLLTLIAVVELIRTPRRVAPLVVFTIGTLGLVGGKSSSLPVVICGLLAVIVLSWFWDRPRLRWHLTLLGIAAAGFLVSTLATAAASSGGALQAFSTVGITRPWRILLTGRSIGHDVDPIIPGLDIRGAGLLLVLILVSYFIAGAAAWIGVPLMVRKDLAAWFLFCVGIAAFAALQLVKVGGESQQYFMRGALPAWALLAALGTYAACLVATRSMSRESALLWLIVAAAAGRLLARTAALSVAAEPGPAGLNAAVAEPIITYSVPFVILVALVALFNRRLIWLFAAGLVLGGQGFWVNIFQGADDAQYWTTAAAIAAGLLALLALVLRRTSRLLPAGWVSAAVAIALVAATAVAFTNNLALTRERAGGGSGGVAVSAGEVEAALWVNANVDDDALLATNVHCWEPPTEEACLTQGFWVAGLSGKRVLIGGWSYTPPAHRAHGQDGLPSRRQPFHDQELYATNEQAFTDPTSAVLEELRERGVSVLFGAAAHSDISPALDELATELFRNDVVVVYSIEG